MRNSLVLPWFVDVSMVCGCGRGVGPLCAAGGADAEAAGCDEARALKYDGNLLVGKRCAVQNAVITL